MLLSGVLAGVACAAERSFVIAEPNVFLKDGTPMLLFSGSFHYARADPGDWEPILQRIAAMGLNTLQTYVFWNFHQPTRSAAVDFTGTVEPRRDLGRFLRAAQSAGLIVLLRGGPYACAEWDGGGLPGWLLTPNSTGGGVPSRIRTWDLAYIKESGAYLSALYNFLSDGGYLYAAGGPVVAVQIENEYGSYGDVSSSADDKRYFQWLSAVAKENLTPTPIIYTTDGGSLGYMTRGTLGGSWAYAVGDFGPGDDKAATESFAAMAKMNLPNLSPPLVSEYYTGWLTHWGEPIANTSSSTIRAGLRSLVFSHNASFSLYMAFGGTNPGLWNGANGGGTSYAAVITSYDYNSPITEDGRHGRGSDGQDKFLAVLSVLRDYYSAHSLPAPPPEPAAPQLATYGSVVLGVASGVLGGCTWVPIAAGAAPPMFEDPALRVYFGAVAYQLVASGGTGRFVEIDAVHDVATVLTANASQIAGTVYRPAASRSQVPLPDGPGGDAPVVVVESLGRLNYGGQMFDPKGLPQGVGPASAVTATAACAIPLDGAPPTAPAGSVGLPSLAFGTLTVPGPAAYATYLVLDGSGLSRGVVWLNGKPLGRYWEGPPMCGPQHALYIAAGMLNVGANEIAVLDFAVQAGLKVLGTSTNPVWYTKCPGADSA